MTWAAWKLVSVHRLVSTAPLLPYTEAFGSISMSSFFFQTYCISSEQSEQHRKTRLRFNWAEPGGDVELSKPISQTVGGILFQLYCALKQNKQTGGIPLGGNFKSNDFSYNLIVPESPIYHSLIRKSFAVYCSKSSEHWPLQFKLLLIRGFAQWPIDGHLAVLELEP